MLKKAGIAISALLFATSAEGLDLGVSIGGVDAAIGIGEDGIGVDAGAGDVQVDAGVGSDGTHLDVGTSEVEEADSESAPPAPSAAGSDAEEAPSSADGESTEAIAVRKPASQIESGGRLVQEVAAVPPSRSTAYDDVIDFTKVSFVQSHPLDDVDVGALRDAISRNPELLAFLERHGYSLEDVVGIEFLPDGATRILVSRLIAVEEAVESIGSSRPDGDEADPLLQRSQERFSMTTTLASAFCMPVDRVVVDGGLDLGAPYSGALPVHDRSQNGLNAFARLFEDRDYESLSKPLVQSAALTRQALEDGWWWLPQRTEVAEACTPSIGLIALR